MRTGMLREKVRHIMEAQKLEMDRDILARLMRYRMSAVSNTYLGSMEQHNLTRMVGGARPEDFPAKLAKATRKQVTAALERYRLPIMHMQSCPTMACPCCGNYAPVLSIKTELLK